jgi:hypothetical protein
VRTRLASLLCAAALVAAAVMVPSAPAFADSPTALSCTVTCELTIGTTSSHVLHVSTTGLNGSPNLVTVYDNQTHVYVYNNQRQLRTSNLDTWIGGLYGESYTARVVCGYDCRPGVKTLYFANY